MKMKALHNRLIARILCALLLVTLLLPSAISCGFAHAEAPTDADKALFTELIEANSFSEIINRHSSKQSEVVYYNADGEEVHRFVDYVDAGQFSEETNGNGHIVTDTLQLWAETDDIGPYLLEVLLDEEDAYRELLASRQVEASLSIEPEETLTEATEQNGCWYMTTEIADADWVSARLESDASTSGIEPLYAYAEGMSFAYCYVFDAETKDLLEIRTSLREADGTVHSYALDKVSYDMEYNTADSVFASYFEATEYSTLHLVFGPGTPEEFTATYMIPKGIYWTVEYQGVEYNGNVYTDPECTQVYEGGKRPDEVTLYIPVQN